MSVATKRIKNKAIANIDTKDPSLVLYLPLHYPYSDMTGSTIYSYDRYRYSCSITGAVWGSQGRRWDAAGDDYININSALTPLAATTKGTWIAWVKLDDATPAITSRIISFGDTNANEYIALWVITDGKIGAAVVKATGTQWYLTTDSAALSDGIFTHIALIHNGTSPIMLVNGVQVAQTLATYASAASWFAADTGLDNGRLGCISFNNSGNKEYIRNSNIGEVLLYNRALSIAEIQNIYLSTKWRYK